MPRWSVAALRGWLGVLLAASGVALLWFGWYRASGETLVAAQLPYLASASLPGAALLAAGVILIGGEISRHGSQQTEEMVGALYRLLTEEAPSPTAASPADQSADGPIVTVAGGTRYHRPGCLLVEGKPDVRAVDAAEVSRLGLQSCPVCSPPTPEG